MALRRRFLRLGYSLLQQQQQQQQQLLLLQKLQQRQQPSLVNDGSVDTDAVLSFIPPPRHAN